MTSHSPVSEEMYKTVDLSAPPGEIFIDLVRLFFPLIVRMGIGILPSCPFAVPGALVLHMKIFAGLLESFVPPEKPDLFSHPSQ